MLRQQTVPQRAAETETKDTQHQNRRLSRKRSVVKAIRGFNRFYWYQIFTLGSNVVQRNAK